MATRVRETIVQTATGYIRRKQVGIDGELPANADAMETEYATLEDVASAIENDIDALKAGMMGSLGLAQVLRANQGNPVALSGVTISTILDEDPGQFGVRFVSGS